MAFHASTPTRFASGSSSPLSLHSTTTDESHRGFNPRLRHDHSQHYTSEGAADDPTDYNGTSGNIYNNNTTINNNNNNNNNDSSSYHDHSYNRGNSNGNSNGNGNRPMNHTPQSPLQRVADRSEPQREHEWDGGHHAPQWGSTPLHRLEVPHRPYSIRTLMEPPQRQRELLEKTGAHESADNRRSSYQPRLTEDTMGKDGDEEMVDLEELQARTRPARRQQERPVSSILTLASASAVPRSFLRHKIVPWPSSSPLSLPASPLTPLPSSLSSLSSWTRSNTADMHTNKATMGAEDPAADVGITAIASTPPRSLPPPASSSSSSSSSITSFPHPRRSPPTQAQNQAPQDAKKEESIPMSLSISSSSLYSFPSSSTNKINKVNPASQEGGVVSDKNNRQRGAMDVDDDYGEGDQHGQIPAGTDTGSIPASSSSSHFVNANDTGQSRIGQEDAKTNRNATTTKARPHREELDDIQDERSMDGQVEDTTRAEAPSSSSSLSKAGVDLSETTQRRMLGRSSEPAVSISPLTSASSAAASADLTTAPSPQSHPYHQNSYQQQHQRPVASPYMLGSGSIGSTGRPPYPPQQQQLQQSDHHYRYHSQQQPPHPNYNSSSSGTGPGDEGASSSFASAYTGGLSREEGGPPLSNKRRSLADLLFVPIKSKEKRKSSASSASSTDSYRQDEMTERERGGGGGTEAEQSTQGQQQQPDSHADWTKHPNSSAIATLASLSSSSSSPPSSNSSAPPIVPSVLAGPTPRAMDNPTSPSSRRSLSRPSSSGGGGLAGRGPRGGSLSSSHLPLSTGPGQSPGGAGSSVSSPKTFQCTGYPGCNMVFTRSEHLARHERKHTGEKPYKCIVANCPRTFSRYDNMIQHTQTHGDRSKRDSLVAAAGASASSATQSRSSSIQSTPQLSGRPRGGSSPMVFQDDRSAPSSTQPSPAMSSYGVSPGMNYHHPPQGPHHPMQWTHPSGTPAAALSSGGGYSHGYPPGSSPTTPMIRTLKANSRSLPHLQPRNSPGGGPGPGDSPGAGLQQGMSSMEIEELKRRKSEVLLPSYSRAGGSGPPVVGQGFGPGSSMRPGRGAGTGSTVGLGMSPFTPTTSHPQSLPKVEQLTPQEQERLNEHRRSAQAALFKNSTSTGSMDSRLSGMREQSSSPYRSASLATAYGVAGVASEHDKDRVLEHRKSTSALVNSSPGYQKRSSNDPADMVIQPLPSRDARSGMQWFSQANAHTGTPPPPPLTGSPRSSITPRDQTPVALASFAAGEQPFGHPSRALMSSSSTSSQRSSLDEGSTVLPPILGNYDQQQEQHEALLAAHTQPRRRTPSSQIHPLSRPSSFQYDPPSKGTGAGPMGPPRFKYEPNLAPGLERELEERFYPIRKREVVEEIERMDAEQFVHLRSLVSTTFATEQFRNPEALCNMTAILCVIRSTATDSAATQDFRRGSRDMEVDDEGSGMTDPHSSSMDVDHGLGTTFKPCRAVLDVDVDGFRRDPEQGRGDIEDLTLSSRFPITSFISAFETAPPSSASPPPQWPYSSQSGCPEAARLGRFYLPENSFRPKESLQLSRAMIDPAGPWEVCEFREFPGLGLWVQQETLLRYRTLAAKGSAARQPYRMALTLVERGLSRRGSDLAVKLENRDEFQEDNAKEDVDDDVRLKESVLYPDMIERVWSDMFQQYQTHQHRLQQQQHQQHHPPQSHHHHHHQPYPPPQYHHRHQHSQSQLQQSQLPPPLQKRVATYEEYHNSLQQQHLQQQQQQAAAESSGRRESSYHPQQQQQHQHQPLYFQPPPPQATVGGAYQEYRQHRPSGLHREDLSSAPSSPRSPSVRDDLPEETSSLTSGSTNGGGSTATAAAAANMHRRISIAELCNPMQGLATERDRLREGDSKRSSM